MPGSTNAFQPLNCQLFRVFQPETCLLYGDCGTRPGTGNVILYQNDSLYYTTDYISAAGMPSGTNLCTLDSTLKYTGLAGKLPINATKYVISASAVGSINKANRARHVGDRINVVFCDGHAEGIFPAGLSKGSHLSIPSRRAALRLNGRERLTVACVKR